MKDHQWFLQKETFLHFGRGCMRRYKCRCLVADGLVLVYADSRETAEFHQSKHRVADGK